MYCKAKHGIVSWCRVCVCVCVLSLLCLVFAGGGGGGVNLGRSITLTLRNNFCFLFPSVCERFPPHQALTLNTLSFPNNFVSESSLVFASLFCFVFWDSFVSESSHLDPFVWDCLWTLVACSWSVHCVRSGPGRDQCGAVYLLHYYFPV